MSIRRYNLNCKKGARTMEQSEWNEWEFPSVYEITRLIAEAKESA
ncbi:hypothetical protein [Aneurinibacillus migulanus]|nr:hypothetical protein [Aneurinibacillus migulanus]